MKPGALAIILFTCLSSLVVAADDPKKDADGFVPLFNGKDLSGWVNVNCHPDSFFVKDGMIITTGKPTGYMRTEKHYENFIAEFEWMHVPEKADAIANSGFFVWGDSLPVMGSPFTRGIEVQVLVNLTYKHAKTGEVTASSHGDVFAIQGATCTPDRPHPNGSMRCIPSENRAKGANEWNHYKIIANDGVVKLHVNGKEVSGVSKCNPRKGYLALESEGSECRFRNLKIKELPSTNPKPEEVATEAKGHKLVYTGLDLSNFARDPGHDGHWVPNNYRLHYDGKSEGEPKSLYLDKDLGDYELVVDWNLPAAKAKENKPRQASLILREGNDYMLSLSMRTDGRLILLEDTANNSEFLLDKQIDVNGPGKWNRTIVTLKDGKLTVNLNGKPVVEGLAVSKSLKSGEVALMDSGTEIEFANLFIRELK